MLVEAPQENKTRVMGSQFLQTRGTLLEYGFLLLPGVADSSEFTSDCSLLLAVIFQLNV